MKKVLSLSLGLIFIGNFLFAQSPPVPIAGDYRTAVASGNWSTLTTWQIYNGTNWNDPVTAYPGQLSSTATVLIRSDATITLNVPATIDSLFIGTGTANNSLAISAGGNLTVTGGVYIIGANGGPAGTIKSLAMTGGTLTAASLVLVPGNTVDKFAAVQFSSGTVNITGDISMGVVTFPTTSQINFTTGGTLNVGGNITGGQITPGSGNIVFNGSGTQTITSTTTVPANTLTNLGMTNGSTLQLGSSLTVSGTLTLTNGKINTGINTLTLSGPVGSQIVGGISTSYVYSTGVGRLRRNGLTAATHNFPVGTSLHYMPVTLTPTATNDFAVNVFTPATINGVEGSAPITNLSSMVNAVWNIDQVTGTGTAEVVINWVDALEGSNFTTYGNSQIGISQNNAGVWGAAIATGANAAANNVTASFATFSPFGVGLIGAALPVKFGAIKAYEKQNGIQLDWKVYSENKVKTYEIERSGDGRSYTTVGSLAALYNNKAEGDYGFFDANPLPGISYYRIKNNDLDGKSAYSIVVRVNRNKAIQGLSLYPNPVLNRIVTLQGSDLGRGNYKINIFGANGQEIFKQQIKHNGGTISQTIELPPTISKGIYMFTVKDESGNIIFNDKLVNQ